MELYTAAQTLNGDLLDIEGCYIDKGDLFRIALDDRDRVVGSIGCNLISENEAVLHRLYVKCDRKRTGIGSALLEAAEAFAREHGRTVMRVHLGDKTTYYESRIFYLRRGYVYTDEDHMEKLLQERT